MSKSRRSTLLLVVAVAIVAGITAAVLSSDDNDKPDRTFTTLTDPPGPAAPVVVDANQTMQPDEQAEAAESSADKPGNIDLHEDTKDETPPGVTGDQLAKGREATKELADEVLVEPVPPAGAQAYSCPAAYVQNQSSLAGRRVGTALHFTVSSPGSLLAIRGLFNTPSFGASSNKGLELSGRCQTWVPNGRKAWAQGAANSAYISIEIVTRDLTRAQWLASSILKRGTLAAIVRDQNRSVGAPLKHVNPSGCVWTPGITDHDALECGNTHWDVGKNFPWDVFMRQVRRGVEATSADRLTCRKLNAWRDAKSPKGGQWEKNSIARRKALARRGVTCLSSGPVRR